MYIFDSYALQYMLEDFPQKAVPELFEKFCQLCSNGTIISERETRKRLETETVEVETIDWCKKNSGVFKPLSEADSITLANLMIANIFEFLDNEQLAVRRSPEGLPFILSMAKAQSRCFVYRKNKNREIMQKILKICKQYEILYLEVDEFLIKCRKLKGNSI